MAVKCRTIKGKEVCSKPDLFMRKNLGMPPFPLFSDEAQDVFDLMDTEPSPPQLKSLMATFIDSQVASGNFALMDCFQFYAMDTAANAVINWIGDFSNGLLVNSPTFDAFDGITGDGVNQYINTQYNPTDDGVNVGQDDLQVGVWMVDNMDAGNNKTLFGSSNTALRQRTNPDIIGRNNSAGDTIYFSNLFLDGKLYSLKRVDSANQIGIEDDTEVSGAVASSGLADADFNVLANSSASNELNAKVACFYATAAVGFDTTNFFDNLKILVDETALLG